MPFFFFFFFWLVTKSKVTTFLYGKIFNNADGAVIK
jgi:hypothetical protein